MRPNELLRLGRRHRGAILREIKTKIPQNGNAYLCAKNDKAQVHEPAMMHRLLKRLREIAHAEKEDSKIATLCLHHTSFW